MKKLESTIKELAEVYRAGGVKTVRFSITVSENENELIEKIAEGLQMSKQALISRILSAAISDLTEELAETESVDLSAWLDDE